MEKKNLFLVIILVLIVILLGLTGYLAYQSSNPLPIPANSPSSVASPSSSCPPGMYDYGIPLGCVTLENINYCKSHPCPVCLASNTTISTPNGEINVKNIKDGMEVYSTNASGEKIISKVTRISSITVPHDHKVVHLVFDDKREFWLSAGHPLVNGMLTGQLRIGDKYDGKLIKKLEVIAYWDTKTYDLLPDSETGFYWANDILVASTLK